MVTELPLIRCPPLISSLFSDSELVLGRVAGPRLTVEFPPRGVAAGGLGGRGGGGSVGMEVWSSAWLRESTLGVEDGRRGRGGCGVDAGRGTW